MIAFIEALKDDTCTPKPAKLNAWVHLKVSYETDTVSRSRSFLFPQLYLCSVNFTCNPQVCFGSSLCDTYIAPDQFRHWSAAWQPRLEPALQESPNALNSQSTKGIRR